MPLPPLASVADFEARYPRDLRAGEQTRVEALLADASARARKVARTDFMAGANLGEVPAVVVAIVLDAAIRAFENPAGLDSATIGDYTYRTRATAALTDDEKKDIREEVGIGSVGTLQLEGHLAPFEDEIQITQEGA